MKCEKCQKNARKAVVQMAGRDVYKCCNMIAFEDCEWVELVDGWQDKMKAIAIRLRADQELARIKAALESATRESEEEDRRWLMMSPEDRSEWLNDAVQWEPPPPPLAFPRVLPEPKYQFTSINDQVEVHRQRLGG